MSRTRAGRGFRIATLAGLSLGLVAAAAPRPLSDCAIAQSWAADNSAELPTTLAEMSALPVSYRRAAFRLLPKTTKISLFREHLEGFATPTSNLTERQKEFVREVAAELEVHFDANYSGPDSPLDLRIRELFDVRTAREVFASLGPDDPAMSGPRLGDKPVSALFARLDGVVDLVFPPQTYPDCSCASGSNWCGGSTPKCYLPELSDCVVTWGCGTLFLYECDGLCGKNVE